MSQNIGQLKMTAPDGKQRLTDVADTEQVLRLIQSVPSKNAESKQPLRCTKIATLWSGFFVYGRCRIVPNKKKGNKRKVTKRKL